MKSCLRESFIKSSTYWGVYKSSSPFKRRVACIEWHPTYHNVVAYGCYSGDILLWNLEDPSRNQFIEGLGTGHGAITSMKFHPENPRLMYTTLLDGRCCLQDFEGRQSEVYLDTLDIMSWWCSLDFSRELNVIFVGGNNGEAVLLDSDGGVVRRYRRLHKGKIRHAEFCPGCSWMLATASVDRTVALWDIRMLRSRPEDRPLAKDLLDAVAVMKHGAPINSAVFDPIYGNRILTTSQDSELRVYESHDWSNPSVVVKHPHRHFQHITPIQAVWHPFYKNLCVVGRYPAKEDDDQTRCVDLVDLKTGERVGYFYSPHFSGIIALSKFNHLGDTLASGMGYHALTWKPPESVEMQVRKLREDTKGKSVAVSGDGMPGVRQRRARQQGDKNKLKRKRSSLDDQTTRKKIKALTCKKKK